MSYSNYEHQTVEGSPNPKYVDLLDEDKVVAGQKFVCVSFISPENIIKQKNLFFFESFLKKWEFGKSMEKFVEFLNFTSYKYNLSFDDLTTDLTEFVKEEKAKLSSINMDDDFKTYLDNNEDELEGEFMKTHKFATCTRGIKVRGAFPTEEEAKVRAKLLRETDPNHDVFVGPVGIWIPWDPESYKTGNVQYLEDELNELMNEKIKNDGDAKVEFDERVKESKRQAIKDNIEKAQTSGNVLSQTIDENGNLIGINNNSQAETLLAKQESTGISASDVIQEMFEGDDIVTGKTDNGKSQLISGPLSSST